MRCGDRLRRARTLRGMSMKELGLEMHYPYKSADIRIAQYEKGLRGPKTETVEELAKILKVNPRGIVEPEGYTVEDIMEMLFEIEEQGYTVEIHRRGESLTASISGNGLDGPLAEWRRMKNRRKNERISESEYVFWKLCWPE